MELQCPCLIGGRRKNLCTDMETAAHAIAREPLCFPLCTIENFLRFQSQDKHNASSYFDMSRIDLLQSGCKNTHKKVENASFYDKSDSAEPALCFLPSSFTPHIHQGTPQEPSPPLWTAPQGTTAPGSNLSHKRLHTAAQRKIRNSGYNIRNPSTRTAPHTPYLCPCKTKDKPV